ncbi:MAG: FlgD immunoglobulin-like domain containing protein [Candidatus Eisenbacteria bacterium]
MPGVRNTGGNSQIDRIDPSVPVVTGELEIVEPTNPVAISDGPGGRPFVLGGTGKLGWCDPDGTNQSWTTLDPPTGTYDGMTGRPGSDLLYLLRNTSGDTKVDVYDPTTNEVTFDLSSLPLPTSPSDITDGPNDLLYVIGDGGANPTAFTAVDPVTGENLALFDILDFTGTYRTITGFHGATSDAPLEEHTLPTTIRHLAWPNPFGPRVEIRYELREPTRVEAGIVDVHGRRVRELRHGLDGGGWHTLHWDGRDDRGHDLPNGTYFYRIVTGGAEASGTLVKVR